MALVVGLAAHVGGSLLESSATTEPPKLAADLLYQFGLALWTGVVLVVFIEIWPEAKRRQYKRGPRCLRGDGRPPGPGRKWPGRRLGERRGALPGATGMTGRNFTRCQAYLADPAMTAAVISSSG